MARAVVSRCNVPLTSSSTSLMFSRVSCSDKLRSLLFNSISVYRWVAMRLASNSPFCQKSIFLLRQSTASIEWPSCHWAFRFRLTSQRLANTLVSRSSKVSEAWRITIRRTSISRMRRVVSVVIVSVSVSVVSVFMISQLVRPS